MYKDIFDHYYARLFTFASRSARNRETAEELAMNVLLKVWQQKETMREVSDFGKYIFQML